MMCSCFVMGSQFYTYEGLKLRVLSWQEGSAPLSTIQTVCHFQPWYPVAWKFCFQSTDFISISDYFIFLFAAGNWGYCRINCSFLHNSLWCYQNSITNSGRASKFEKSEGYKWSVCRGLVGFKLAVNYLLYLEMSSSFMLDIDQLKQVLLKGTSITSLLCFGVAILSSFFISLE